MNIIEAASTHATRAPSRAIIAARHVSGSQTYSKWPNAFDWISTAPKYADLLLPSWGEEAISSRKFAGYAHGYAKRAEMNVDVTKRRIARIVLTHALDAPTSAAESALGKQPIPLAELSWTRRACPGERR